MKHYLIEKSTLPEAYHESLKILYHNGKDYPCPDYNTNMKEISLTYVVENPLQEPMISKIYPGGFEELQQYIMEVLDGILDFKIGDGLAWEYTYHDRFVRQLPFIYEELKRNPYSRRAIMNIRDFEVDSKNDHPACLQSIQYFIRDNKLHAKVMMRSNDSIKANFMNVMAFIMLQKRVADILGYEIGTYSHTVNSFHVYERDYDLLEKAVKDIESKSIELLTYEYQGFFKDLMEESIESIVNKVEELKRR